MTPEIEAKFLNVTHDDIRNKLQRLGGKCEIPMRTMKRVVLDFPDKSLQKKQAWLRVRDEGNKITVTYKVAIEGDAHGTHEIETITSSYEDTIRQFEALGMQRLSSQETRRETWKLADSEVVLDEWPWLEPFIEIEGPSHESIQKIAKQLGLDWSEAIFGTVLSIYQKVYPAIGDIYKISDLEEVTFSTPRPAWFTKD